MVTNLITGIGGFVASHLADLLLEKGEKVVGTYRWTEDLSRIQHIKDKITLVPMDINDLSSCIRVLEEHKPEYIFHLAAQSYVGDSYSNPLITVETNTMGTMKLLEAVRLVKGNIDKLNKLEMPTYEQFFDPVIHVCSSSEVYGLVTEDLIPIKEDCRFNPSNPYAVGKVGTDMAALLYFTNFGIKTIRTRMFTHTGPRRTMMSAECAFAKQIAEFEKDWNRQNVRHAPKDYILKHGNLESVRTFADVRDAAKAYYQLVRKCKPGEVYNIGGDHTCTIGEMLHTLLSLSPLCDKIKLEVDPKLLRPYDVTLQIPDCSKFKKETNWKPEIPFKKTMKDLLDFWRQNV